MQNERRQAIQAGFWVALSGILYGFLGFLGTKVIQENVDIFSMLFFRFSIAGIWMLFFVIQKGWIKEIFSIDRRVLWFTLFLGAIGYAGSSGFYFFASEYMGTGLAMVIFFSYPMIIAISSWLTRKNTFNLKTFLILIAMAIGMYLLHDSSEDTLSIIGILLGVASALCYSFYLVGSKKYSSANLNSNVLTLLVSFGCAVIFLILSLVKGSLMVPVTLKSWGYLLSLGVFATALPIQLMLKGLKKISSLRASIISVLEPFVTLFVGVVLLEESVSNIQMLGATIILGSALIVQFQKEL